MEIERRVVLPEMRFSDYQIPITLPASKYVSQPLPLPSVIENNTAENHSIKKSTLILGGIALVCVCWYVKVRIDKKRKIILETSKEDNIIDLDKALIN